MNKSFFTPEKIQKLTSLYVLSQEVTVECASEEQGSKAKKKTGNIGNGTVTGGGGAGERPPKSTARCQAPLAEVPGREGSRGGKNRPLDKCLSGLLEHSDKLTLST